MVTHKLDDVIFRIQSGPNGVVLVGYILTDTFHMKGETHLLGTKKKKLISFNRLN